MIGMSIFSKKKFKESDCCRYCKNLSKNGEEYSCKYSKGEFKLSGICKKYIFKFPIDKLKKVCI